LDRYNSWERNNCRLFALGFPNCYFLGWRVLNFLKHSFHRFSAFGLRTNQGILNLLAKFAFFRPDKSIGIGALWRYVLLLLIYLLKGMSLHQFSLIYFQALLAIQIVDINNRYFFFSPFSYTYGPNV